MGASDPTADRSSRGPDADESTFRYATAFCLSSAANCSPHSVDPVSVTSSPSQAQNTSVRLGRVPSCLSRPSDLVSSIIDAVPLEGLGCYGESTPLHDIAPLVPRPASPPAEV